MKVVVTNQRTAVSVLGSGAIDVTAGAGHVAVSSGTASASTSSFYDIRDSGAVDGAADNTPYIQDALNLGGNIYFPPGVWNVDAVTGLFPVSDSWLLFAPGSVVRAITNGADIYRVFNISGVDNVTISGPGLIEGDLLTHTGTTGQYGHCIYVTNGSSNVTIRDVTIRYAWGDGIYFGGTAQVGPCLAENVTVDDCRREGIAPFWCKDVTVKNCRILNSGVTATSLGVPQSPSSGIDIEPNPGESCINLRIEGCWIEGTQGCGIYCSPNSGPITQLEVRDTMVKDCGGGAETLGLYRNAGIEVSNCVRPRFVNVSVTGSTYDTSVGAFHFRETINPEVVSCWVRSNAGKGFMVERTVDAVIKNCTIRQSSDIGIDMWRNTDTIVQGCQFIDNADSGATVNTLRIHKGSGVVVRDCVFQGVKGDYWVSVYDSESENHSVLGCIGMGSVPSLGGPIQDNGTGTYVSGNVIVPSGVTW